MEDKLGSLFGNFRTSKFCDFQFLKLSSLAKFEFGNAN